MLGGRQGREKMEAEEAYVRGREIKENKNIHIIHLWAIVVSERFRRNLATSAIPLFGNDLNLILDREWQV
jgi:hypothetical protein